jgi:hypothetical protein
LDGRKWLGLAAVVLVAGAALASQVPNIWAARTARLHHGDRLVYSGTLPRYLDDAAADWSFMRQAADGRFFFHDLYTPDPHPRTYVNSLLWTLGTAARVTGASLVTMYDVAKWGFIALLMYALWRLAGACFARPGERLACLALLVFASGWEGPIAFLQRHAGVSWSASSPGWWMPEISTFFSMILFPHLTAGFAAIVGSILLMLAAWDPARGDAARAWLAAGAGAVLLVLTLFHPYDTVTAMATLVVAVALIGAVEKRWPRPETGALVVAFSVALPAIVYDLVLLRTNPAVAGWDAQNVMETPSIAGLFMCLGPNLLLALVAVVSFRKLPRPLLVMVAWVVAVAVLIHLPLRFQRRMLGGVQLPLAALACAALSMKLAPWIKRGKTDALGWKPLALVMLIAPLNVITPCYVHQDQWRAVRRLHYPSWLGVEEVQAMKALGVVSPPGAVAIASYQIGNFLPALSGRTSFFGHPALTMNSKARAEDVTRFYTAGPDDDAWRQALLRQWNVGYVLYTPRERALGSFDPSKQPWLEEIFVIGDDPARRAAIYKVKRSDG